MTAKTVRDLLKEARHELATASVETPVLDATVLLAEAIGVSKEELLASYPEQVPPQAEKRFRTMIAQRLSGIPVSYIRRKKEFYGLEFAVDPRVLVPRPDTETLVDRALELATSKPWIRRVHDVGTGSGCIAVAVAKMRPDLDVRASDVSADVAPVFRRNCRSILGRELPFTVGAGAEAIDPPVELIVSNPPYLTAEEVAAMQRRGWPEPETALLGGEDGLAVPRMVIQGAFGALAEDGYLLLEAASWQMPALADILAGTGFTEIRVHADLGGRDRVIEGRRTANR